MLTTAYAYPSQGAEVCFHLLADGFYKESYGLHPAVDFNMRRNFGAQMCSRAHCGPQATA